ncbi:hypothetical protein ACFE04_011867 [Oxalis oulophora]
MSEELKKRSLINNTDDQRKSSSTSSTSSSSASSLTNKKAVIKNADMKTDMINEAIDIAIKAFEKNGVEKDVAENIKKDFDTKYGATWHCIVGRNFGIIICWPYAGGGVCIFWQ